jgi:hypothetical protein
LEMQRSFRLVAGYSLQALPSALMQLSYQTCRGYAAQQNLVTQGMELAT